MKKFLSTLLLLSLTMPIAHADLPGMPPILDKNDIYSADRPNQLSDTVKNMPERVYVPNFQIGRAHV